MRFIAPCIGLLLFVCVARADDPTPAASRPIGLTLNDLRAIRRASKVWQNWLPPLSPAVKALLLDRSEGEVVQIVLQPNGVCQYRGRTEPRLLAEQGIADDYSKLAQALQTPDFKKVIELVESSSSPQVYTNLGAYGQQLKEWNDDVAQLAASPSEKEGLRLFLGESLLQIPEESRKSLWTNANVKAELGPLVEKARQQEIGKLAAVKAGEAKPASARDERVLAGQLVHVVNENYKSKAWSLNAVTEPPDDDDKQIYTFSFEPGAKPFSKPTQQLPKP